MIKKRILDFLVLFLCLPHNHMIKKAVFKDALQKRAFCTFPMHSPGLSHVHIIYTLLLLPRLSLSQETPSVPLALTTFLTSSTQWFLLSPPVGTEAPALLVIEGNKLMLRAHSLSILEFRTLNLWVSNYKMLKIQLYCNSSDRKTWE